MAQPGLIRAPTTPAGDDLRQPDARPTVRLARELAAATSVREASEAVVEHLAGRGLLPSVYLQDGGRLRCQAVRGYWQIFDGMPVSAGVIGRTYRSGDRTVIDDVAASADYLPAVAAVVAEVARRCASTGAWRACSTRSRRPRRARPAWPRSSAAQRCWAHAWRSSAA